MSERLPTDPLIDQMAALPGCDLVLLTDLEAGTVLDSRSRHRVPQERLDALGAWATAMIDHGGALAVAAGDTALRLVFRTGDGGSEAMCVVLHPGADCGAALTLARAGVDP